MFLMPLSCCGILVSPPQLEVSATKHVRPLVVWDYVFMCLMPLFCTNIFCFQILHCGSSSGNTDHRELLMAILAWFQPQALPKISGWWKAILSIIRYISSSTKPSAHNAEQQIYVFSVAQNFWVCNSDYFLVLRFRLTNIWLGEMVSFLCFPFELKVEFEATKKYISTLVWWQMEESMEAVRRVQAQLQMGSKCSYTIFEQHENKIVMCDGNKFLYLVFVGCFFSQHLGLLLEQLGQHLRLLWEQLWQQHLVCFVRTAASWLLLGQQLASRTTSSLAS
jgi:hypothetical protein